MFGFIISNLAMLSLGIHFILERIIIPLINIDISDNVIEKSIFFLVQYIAFIITMHVVLFSLNKVSYFKIPPIILYKNENKNIIKLSFYILIPITIFLWIISIATGTVWIRKIYILIYMISIIFLTYLLYTFFKLNYKYMVESEGEVLTVRTGMELYNIISLMDINVTFFEVKEIFESLLQKLNEEEKQKFNQILKNKISRYYSNKDVEYLFLEYILECNSFDKKEKNKILLEKFNKNRYQLLAKYTIQRIKKNNYNKYAEKDFLIDLFLEKISEQRVDTPAKNAEFKKLSDFMDNYINNIKVKLLDKTLPLKYFSQFLLYKENHINQDLYFKKFIDLLFTEENLNSNELLKSFEFILKYCTNNLTFKVNGNILSTNNNMEMDEVIDFVGSKYKIEIGMDEELSFENIKNKIKEKIKRYEEMDEYENNEFIVRAYLDLCDMRGLYRYSNKYINVPKVNIVNEHSKYFLDTIQVENQKFIQYFKEKGHNSDLFQGTDLSRMDLKYDPNKIIGSHIGSKLYCCLVLENHKGKVQEKQKESLKKIIDSYEKYINSLKDILSNEEEVSGVLNEGIKHIDQKNIRATSFINNLCQHLFRGKELEDKLGVFNQKNERIVEDFIGGVLLKYAYVVDEKTLNSSLLIYYISSKKVKDPYKYLLFFNNKKYSNLSDYRILLMCMDDVRMLETKDFFDMKYYEKIANMKNKIMYIMYSSSRGIAGEGHLDWKYDELKEKYIKVLKSGIFSSVNMIGLNELFNSENFIQFLREYYKIKNEKLIDFKPFYYNKEEYQLDEKTFKKIKDLTLD